MGTNPSYFLTNPASGENQGRRPVESVSWYEALIFCNRLSIREGFSPAYEINGSTNPDTWGRKPIAYNPAWELGSDPEEFAIWKRWNSVKIVPGSTGYRLPTEAQWEYACRAGTTSDFGNGQNHVEPPFPNNFRLHDHAGWWRENSFWEGTREVGQRPIMSPDPAVAPGNNWGLFDMTGNVWEWCWDWFDVYTNNAKTDPAGPSDPTPMSNSEPDFDLDSDFIPDPAPSGIRGRVIRGGSAASRWPDMLVTARAHVQPEIRVNNIGLRVVRP
jgi:formylglycine-generating enzyme required for sulfatase activity